MLKSTFNGLQRCRTLRIYLHSFIRCCLPITKSREISTKFDLTLQQFKAIQGY